MKIKITETEDRIWPNSKSIHAGRKGQTLRRDEIMYASRDHDEKARPIVEKLLTFLDEVLGIQTVAIAEQSKDPSQFVVQISCRANALEPKFSTTPVINGNPHDSRPTRYNTLPFDANTSDFSRIAEACIRGFKNYVNEVYDKIVFYYPKYLSAIEDLFGSANNLTLFEAMARNLGDTLIDEQKFRKLFENTDLELYLDMKKEEFFKALDTKI